MTNPKLPGFLDRLETVRKSRTGFIARCPAHEDRSPSLSIGEGDDGKILIHCFAGCSAPDICAAIGFDLVDLFPDKPMQSNGHRHRIDYKALVFHLRHEAYVLSAAAHSVQQGIPLTEDDKNTLDRVIQSFRLLSESH